MKQIVFIFMAILLATGMASAREGGNEQHWLDNLIISPQS